MKRRRRIFAFPCGCSLALLLAATATVGVQYRQDQLDCGLIQALKSEDRPLAIRLLKSGANANAQDTANGPHSLRDVLAAWWDRLASRPSSASSSDRALAITLVYPYDMPMLFSGDRPSDDPALARALMEHGAHINSHDHRGFTLLHKAVYLNHSGTVRYLLENGADPNAATDDGWVPLTWSNAEIAKMLLKYGAHVDQTGKGRATPVSSAIERAQYRSPAFSSKDIDLISVLLDAHADVNLQDSNGRTPLHYLACGPIEWSKKNGHEAVDREIVRLLLQHGARVEVRDNASKTALDNASKTALDNARQANRWELVPLLEEAARKQRAGAR